MSTQKIDDRFGVTAVKNGFISREQLFEALKIQLAEDLKGLKHRLIGEILLVKEYITEVQIDKVIESMSF
ncbi:MAG: hypothetical protein JSW04_05695 [Desulfobacterales bacterium]|nr:MAG: hypothetical protein JSV38_15860 [Desulfobacterales bacterium]UCD90918.1 MAG: hypothetical protein JSW04_05695 [Desulfobacterales bacterium]